MFRLGAAAAVAAALASTGAATASRAALASGATPRATVHAAASPSYEGTYAFVASCVSVCTGVFIHSLTIASYDGASGRFSGTGYSVSPPTRWTITGTIKGGKVSFHIAYTAGNPGYTFDGTGTATAAGSMSGTGTDFDRTRPAGTLTWTATKEAAPTGIHVGSATVSLSERLKRLARELRPQVEQLVKEKQTLDAELPEKQARFEQAGTAVTDLERKGPPLVARVDEIQAFVKQITAAEPSSSSEPLVPTRDSLDKEMARLQPQIIEAYLAGNTSRAKSLESQLASDERQLNDLETALAGKERKADELRDRWLTSLKALKEKLFALRTQQAQAERARWAAGDELHRTLAQAASVDDQLVALGVKLADLDFDIESVTVTVGASEVFAAELSQPARKLADLDRELAEMKQVLAELQSQRLAASKQYLAAANEALAAGKVVADTIMSVAYKKAGVDFAYNAYDVVRAASKGGLIGAFGEALKKAGEGLVIYLTDTDKTGSKELDALYDANLKEGFGPDKLLTVVRDRLIKDTVSKPLKDKLNQAYLSKLFERLYPDVRLPAGGLPAPTPPANIAERFRNFIKSFSDKQRHLENLKKGITKPWSSLKNARTVGSDLVGKFLEDASKNLAKAYFDAQEQEAWATYFEKEVTARMYFPLWQIASTHYYEALDYYNGLLDQKAALLNGYSEKTNTRTRLDEKFSKDAKLKIVLKVVRPAGTTGTADIVVLIAGKQAAHAGGYEYTISANGLTQGEGGLGLEIKAR